ncbi:VOC family protein [Jannaschia sp. M317]|uniref:VOC family protein n=1 Tax=Jannaschia sp. M317 TaxID=2867011 RepID=UPI0021A3BCEC|nr:VOC family protein [Jannaschia sp. M317]UWQ17949.1 VOC family protein [Jannaschia sp. M317]UWQ18537.1 VOC family protein [Jannaschia sp. M317]
MSWSIDPVNLEARDVRRTAVLYADTLGMAGSSWSFPARRDYLPGDPGKLALLGDGRDGHSGLHLIAADESFARRNGLEHNASIGGHVAFQVADLDAVIARLRRAGLCHSVTGEFAIPGLRHVYVEDPSGNQIEINGSL